MCNVNVVNRISCSYLIILEEIGVGFGHPDHPWLLPWPRPVVGHQSSAITTAPPRHASVGCRENHKTAKRTGNCRDAISTQLHQPKLYRMSKYSRSVRRLQSRYVISSWCSAGRYWPRNRLLDRDHFSPAGISAVWPTTSMYWYVPDKIARESPFRPKQRSVVKKDVFPSLDGSYHLGHSFTYLLVYAKKKLRIAYKHEHQNTTSPQPA